MLKVFVVGNLGKDAIVNDVSGKKVINFSVCDTFKDKNGQERSTWVECAYWTDSAVHQYLKKGTKVAVDGRGELRTWEANGKNGASISIMVSSLELCGQPPAQQQAAPAPGYGQQAPAQAYAPQQQAAPQYAQQPAPAQQQQAQPAVIVAAPGSVVNGPTQVWNGTSYVIPVWNGSAWIVPGTGDLPF